MAACFGVISILAALYQKRGGEGGGADIRIGLFENCCSSWTQHMVEYEMTGNKPRSMPEREHAWRSTIFSRPRRERFSSRLTAGHWQSFLPDSGLKGFFRGSHVAHHHRPDLARPKIIPRVARGIKGWNAAELSAKLDGLTSVLADQSPEDLFDDPHVLAPGGLVNKHQCNGEAFRVPGSPGGMERRQLGRRIESTGARRR